MKAAHTCSVQLMRNSMHRLLCYGWLRQQGFPSWRAYLEHCLGHYCCFGHCVLDLSDACLGVCQVLAHYELMEEFKVEVPSIQLAAVQDLDSVHSALRDAQWAAESAKDRLAQVSTPIRCSSSIHPEGVSPHQSVHISASHGWQVRRSDTPAPLTQMLSCGHSAESKRIGDLCLPVIADVPRAAV